jgi:hypothetical protein
LSVKGSPVGVALAFPAALVAVDASAGGSVAVEAAAVVAVGPVAPVGVAAALGCGAVADGLADEVVAVASSLPPQAASQTATSAQTSRTVDARKIVRAGCWVDR